MAACLAAASCMPPPYEHLCISHDMMMATTSSYLVVRGALWLLLLSLHLFKFLVVERADVVVLLNN
jgi:hypothetical protein